MVAVASPRSVLTLKTPSNRGMKNAEVTNRSGLQFARKMEMRKHACPSGKFKIRGFCGKSHHGLLQPIKNLDLLKNGKQSGTLWYLRIIFSNIIILVTKDKN